MILTDYFLSQRDIAWDYARSCGVENAVIRLPETDDFDLTDAAHWQSLKKRFTDFSINPVIVEPMPNKLHDHIKAGDKLRDECIEKVIKMFAAMDKVSIRMICFNFMAHIGWTRTRSDIPERGGAYVTGFDINEFTPPADKKITESELWDNYTYFIKAVMPYAEKYNIKLALHPDDPPLKQLGNVCRIMISAENIKKAMDICKSDNLGITFCQATYKMMGEDIYKAIEDFKEKIFFVHFRNVRGNKYKFNETFHDNGEIDMADLMRHYKKCGVDTYIRVDHVPDMPGEKTDKTAGYNALGRLFAIGYLKGILESVG